MVDHWTVRRVSLVAGDSLARSMLVGGVQISGPEAVAAGFAQRSGGVEAALEWAAQIAGLAPLTLAGHKLALNRVDRPADDPVVEEARRRAWSSADLEEGIAAFRDRRPPTFRGV
jgi:enoyl-CoA hydratase